MGHTVRTIYNLSRLVFSCNKTCIFYAPQGPSARFIVFSFLSDQHKLVNGKNIKKTHKNLEKWGIFSFKEHKLNEYQ